MPADLHELCVDIDLAHGVDDDGDLEAIAVREDVVEKHRLSIDQWGDLPSQTVARPARRILASEEHGHAYSIRSATRSM
jgi:hypothetical protein